jgi:hypothetical protein
MDTTTYDTQITEVSQQIEQALKDLDEMAEGIIDEYTNFFRRKFTEMVKERITGNPKLAQELGVEKIGEIKRELNEVIANLPEITKDYFNQDELWEHRQQLPDAWEKESLPLYEFKRQAGSKISNAYHDVLGHVGEIMLKHGLISDKSGEWKRENGRLKYAYSLSFYKEEDKILTIKINDYVQKVQQYAELNIKLKKIEAAKQTFIAKSLWDQA